MQPQLKNQPKSQGKMQKELVIDVWYRQGSAYSDEYQCEVIYGDAETKVEYDRRICELNWPYQCPGVFKVRPKSIPTIILCKGVDNTSDEEVRVMDMYVYTQKGWKYMRIYEKRVPL